jgi:hypothetical protein
LRNESVTQAFVCYNQHLRCGPVCLVPPQLPVPLSVPCVTFFSLYHTFSSLVHARPSSRVNHVLIVDSGWGHPFLNSPPPGRSRCPRIICRNPLKNQIDEKSDLKATMQFHRSSWIVPKSRTLSVRFRSPLSFWFQTAVPRK